MYPSLDLWEISFFHFKLWEILEIVFSCGVNPSGLTCKTTKLITQSSENSRIVFPSMGLLRNSKIISAERLKAVKKTPDLSSMKISKYVDKTDSCSLLLFNICSEEFVIYLSDECMPFNIGLWEKTKVQTLLMKGISVF